MGANTKIGIIDQKGGSGHEKAADKIQADCIAEKIEFVRINTTVDDDGWLNAKHIAERFYLDYIPILNKHIEHNFGAEGVIKWNNAQKSGDTNLQKKIASKQFLANIIFAHSFYQHTTKILNESPQLEKIVSTQQVCVASMLNAIADWNKANDKHVAFEIVMTDLPTKSARHFFDSFEMIDLKDLEHVALNLEIPFPAVKMDMPSSADYHVEFAKLCPHFYVNGTSRPKSNIHIKFTNGPIDQSFLDIKKEIDECGAAAVKKKYKSLPWPFKLSKSAYDLVKDLPWLKTLNITEKASPENNQTNFIELNIPENAWVEYILLGSQVSERGALGLIDEAFQLFQLHPKLKGKPFYLFVYCNNDEILLSKVNKLAKEYARHPNFYIIPLSNQAPNSIARMACISDTPGIRSGGMSEMEVIPTATGTVLHYAENDPRIDPKILFDNPKETLVVWELGNFEHAETSLGHERVLVVNLANYLTLRMQELNNRERNAKSIKCVDKELIDIRNKYFPSNLANPQEEIVKTAAAYYLQSIADFSDFTESKSFVIKDALLYGELYLDGLNLLSKHAPSILRNNQREKRHPNAWVVRFVDYLFEHVQIQHSKNLRQTLQSNQDQAIYFANLFYDPTIPVFDEKDALKIMNGNDSKLEADDFEDFVDLKVTEEDIPEQNNPVIQWDVISGDNTQEKIINQLKNYAPQGFLKQTIHMLSHPNRTQQKRANEFITRLEDEKNLNNLALLIHFQRFREECLNDPKVNRKGEFYKLINSIYQSLVSITKKYYQHKEPHNAITTSARSPVMV